MLARLTPLALACLTALPALAQEPPAKAASGSTKQGEAIILQKGCGGCHTIPGIDGADGLVGPPLTQMGRRIFIAGVLRNTPANMAAWVYDPQRYVPGNAMPSVGLSPQDAADVAAYLESLR